VLVGVRLTMTLTIGGRRGRGSEVLLKAYNAVPTLLAVASRPRATNPVRGYYVDNALILSLQRADLQPWR
jgi:hypothetical protein